MHHSAIGARAARCAAVLLLSAGGANAELIYSNSFDTKPLYNEGWNRTRHSTGSLGGFLGRFTTQEVWFDLTLPRIPVDPDPDPDPDPDDPIDPDIWIDDVIDLPQIGPIDTPARSGGSMQVISITFDLYILDSWDGTTLNFGQDRLGMKVNGTELFGAFFNNQSAADNFRRPDDGPRDMGWNRWNDSVYRDIRVDFLVSGELEHLRFKWQGTADQGIDDESWGLDNVRIERFRVVPAPASAAVVLGFGGMVARRRR